jgi:hypothetical protein
MYVSIYICVYTKHAIYVCGGGGGGFFYGLSTNKDDNFANENYIKIEWKSKKVQILELSFCCYPSFEIISETVRERGNLSTYKSTTESSQRNISPCFCFVYS